MARAGSPPDNGSGIAYADLQLARTDAYVRIVWYRGGHEESVKGHLVAAGGTTPTKLLELDRSCTHQST